MKNKTMKKALSLFLAIVMIALALPLTILPVVAAEAAVGDATTIKSVKLLAKYGDEWDVHANYGCVAAITDGDPQPGYVGSDKRGNYTYYQSDDLYDGITYYYLDDGKLVLDDPDGTDGIYMGYAIFELDGVNAIDDVTIWLAGDTAAEWQNPGTAWNMNNDYDILVSNDGETWTVFNSFADMCGDGTNAGAGFPAEGNAARAVDTATGKLGHKIDLNDTVAKYFAIGVKHGMNSKKDGKERNAIVFGEVTVNGTVVTSDAAKQAPADIYAAAEDGDLLQTINFLDTNWSDDYYNSDNWNTYVKVSEDGRSSRHLLHSKTTFGANNRRAMWGGIAEDERFALNLLPSR